MSRLLEGLNDQQKAIVEKTDGYRLVLAGAGTGKTSTLTHSVGYLIEQELAQPHNILAVTFTNKAAQEMKERISALMGLDSKKKWWIGTFHGICVRFLIKHGEHIGIPKYFTIADEKEQLALVKTIVSKYDNLSGIDNDLIIAEISWAKNNLIGPDQLREILKEEKREQLIADIFIEYQEQLVKMNALDFDDLIYRTVRMLQEIPEVRTQIQDQFKYVLVDESQDLNASQYELVKLISDKYKNLCLIGDNDQGIYSWRGANIEIINRFARLPETEILKLEMNYRCSANIIEASNSVIENNNGRLEKTLRPYNGKGNKIIQYTGDSEYEEAEFVASIIYFLCGIKKERNYKDFAILYRTNLQSRVLESELSKRCVKYKIVNGMSFYERKEIKDMLAYLKLIINPRDLLSFQRIANVPKRGVGDTTLKKVMNYITESDKPVLECLGDLDSIPKVSKKAKAALVELKSILEELINLKEEFTIDRFIKELACRTGYVDMLDQDEEKDRVVNIYELANMAANWVEKETKDAEEENVGLEEFVRQMSLISDNDTIDEGDNVVKLMTAHNAKGLEFPVVFIIGMEENIFPHFLSTQNEDGDIEEERRLFYVSMTRAKEQLYLTKAEERKLFGKGVKNKPSRFLNEIPKHLVKKV